MREQTLGILSFVTTRSVFTPAIRERLVRWVAMHYLHGENSEQHEKELQTLLKDVDTERIKTLRNRFQRMRRMTPVRRGSAAYPRFLNRRNSSSGTSKTDKR